ncbi:MAG: Spy/CpxP family protein refolding chaperone [Rhodospirillaceae bacterium]|nr:Spy/CpxP family protein refolding chaperone [Rhodospirillaceae bacterium]
MQSPLLRRATLTALVCAALASPALAQQGPPGPGGPPDREHRRMDRGPHQHWGHGPMRARMGGMGMMPLLGLMPMRPGVEMRYVEGRIAFLKAELKITDAQAKQWDAFAAALRENATKLAEAYKLPDRAALDKMGPGDRIAWYEKALAARLDAVKRTRATLDPLYAALSDDQKKTFDRFVPTGGMRAGMRDRMRERMRDRMHDRREQRRQDEPKKP